jgi:hypothetical protein
MLTDLAPPQIRGITGLELAAGVFGKCSDQLATQLQVSLTSGKRDAGPMPLRIGINGDVYGGMRAPLRSRHAASRYRLRQSGRAGSHGLPRQNIKQKLELRVLGGFLVLGPHRAGRVERPRRQVAADIAPRKIRHV